MRRPVPLVLAAVLLSTACTSGPILANPSASLPSPRPAATPAPRPPDPQPVVLPDDDAPHDRLTEWWYYTGHIRDALNVRYGFEFVVFRAERGGFPVSWASHVALTNQTEGTFHYAQRSEIGPQVDRSATDGGFAFRIAGNGDGAPDPAAPARAPWAMAGKDGADRLSFEVAEDEVEGDPFPGGFGATFELTSTKPAALHDGDGWIDFGPAGGSYYYSRTAMRANGVVEVGRAIRPAVATVWFDHQWGDFISVGGGGWDWFAVNLEDGVELTLSQVRAADGTYPLVYGTLVEKDGSTRHLGVDDFSVEVTDSWTSPTTNARYPAGWRIRVPGEDLSIDLTPTVPQQELDTRATTGVVYWEGSQKVEATRAGKPLHGEAYVELTGYGPAG
jgi:predicted secreted hydrolase